MDESRKKRFAEIWWKSRADAGMTQERLAVELGVSRKTIQNWESGATSPSLYQGTEWFRALGLNPLPYYLSYVFPDASSSADSSKESGELDALLAEAIHSLPAEAKKRLLFILWAEHGSSPTAIFNIINAYLQLPLLDRYKIADSIYKSYQIESELGALVCPNMIQPDHEMILKSIELGKQAIVEGSHGYSMADEDDK